VVISPGAQNRDSRMSQSGCGMGTRRRCYLLARGVRLTGTTVALEPAPFVISTAKKKLNTRTRLVGKAQGRAAIGSVSYREARTISLSLPRNFWCRASRSDRARSAGVDQGSRNHD